MARKPSIAVPELSLLNGSDERMIFSQPLEIKVVTPLFGGGVVAGEVDVSRPINGKAIRGHLRFWWRACQAGAYKDVVELYKYESELWGSLPYIVGKTEFGGPSLVNLNISNITTPNQDNPSDIAMRVPDYVSFPFADQIERSKQQKGYLFALENIQFNLTLTWASHYKKYSHAELMRFQSDIEVALWAWILFGGVGARTRRGCGSLYCTNDERFQLNQFISNQKYIKDKGYIVGTYQFKHPMIPTLYKAKLLLSSREGDTSLVWKKIIKLYRKFRTNEKGMDKKWFESKNILSVMKNQNISVSLRDFPRIDLGLPIIFHIDPKDKKQDVTAQISSERHSRLSSPVIIKPVSISEKVSVLMILVLNAPHISDNDCPLMLKWNSIPGGTYIVNNIQPDGQTEIQSVREEFLKFVEKQLKSLGDKILIKVQLP